MNRKDFISYIAERNLCSKDDAEKMVDVFINSLSSVLSQGESVSFIGFGTFSAPRVEARMGRNPKTGEQMQIAAYNQPKFKAGQKLKDACNNK